MEDLTPEIEAVVERSACLRRGLAFLHRAPLEAVAIALSAQPAVVEQARVALERRGSRAALLRVYGEAKTARHATGSLGSAPPGAALSGALPAPLRSAAGAPAGGGAAEVLVRRAAEHELGIAFLREAPLEVAAIAFAVHPDVVARARSLAAEAELTGPAAWPSLLARADALPPRRA